MRSVGLALVALLAFAGLSGCINAQIETDPDAQESLGATTAFSEYIRSTSPVLDGVTLENAILEQYLIPAVDGSALDTWILRPDIDEPVPVVLEVTPYYGGGPPNFLRIENEELEIDTTLTGGVGTLASLLISHGYAFGISSVRGTGNSEGCFTQGGPEEGKDTARVVEAVAAEPWSNGNVGIIGVSYPGTTPQQVWLEAPPSLKTIVPISGISDFYKYNFKNGVPIWVQGYGFNTYYWPLTSTSPVGLSGGVGLLDPLALPGKIVGEVCQEQLDVQSAGVQATLDGDKTEYWQQRDFPALHRDTWDLNPERASVFYIHGLQDWNVKPHHMHEWTDQIQDSGVDYKIWLGQWGHAWPWREDWWNLTVLAWFDEFLKDLDTGILDAPAVQVQDDEGRWRHEQRWPPEDIDWLRLYPHEDGSLQMEPGNGELTYHDRAGGRLNEVPVGDDVWGEDNVVLRTEPLKQDMLLAGSPVFTANVTATGSRASLMLSLHEVTPEGDRRSFNFGVMSLNHADDLAGSESDISGQRIQVSFELFPQDSLIKTGNHIELIAAPNLIGSPAPAFEPIADGSQITIHLEGAWLALPSINDRVFEDPQPCWENENRCQSVNRNWE
jgi:X-Pro dipeptidyl-peptidase